MQTVFLKRIGIIVAAFLPAMIVGSLVFDQNESDDLPFPGVADSVSLDSTSTAGSAVAPSQTVPSSPPSQGSGTSSTSSSSVTVYADGTYTATGSYVAPTGTESITVTMTVTNDIVTGTSMVSNARGESRSWQQYFSSQYSSQVIGKSLTTLRLSNVSGASLTTNGFNNALTSIKSQAKI